MSGKDDLLRMVRHAAASAEDALDIARRRLWKKTGRHRPRHIAAYQGWADARKVHLCGRVLANRPRGGPRDEDGIWANLLNTYRRWETDEVADTAVTLRFKGRESTVFTNEEGYYEADFDAPVEDHDILLWLTATARAGAEDAEVHAVHDIVVAPRQAEFGIISDLDDTVIHTGITSVLLAAKLTFLENAKTRKPLDGVAKLYSALQNGQAGRPVNPIFYISSSPWNLYDLLADFLQLNDIPPGPILLRDVGLDQTKFLKGKGHGHKRDRALKLLDSFPELRFVLIGDSGQEDPEIYAEVAGLRPGRVKAIYIRDIDPEKDSMLDTGVHRAIERVAALGVPMVLAKDSLMISEHASRTGLIPPAALGAVIEEVEADRSRPDLGEQALEDATGDLLGEEP